VTSSGDVWRDGIESGVISSNISNSGINGDNLSASIASAMAIVGG